jgi:hypothetical protein
VSAEQEDGSQDEREDQAEEGEEDGDHALIVGRE